MRTCISSTSVGKLLGKTTLDASENEQNKKTEFTVPIDFADVAVYYALFNGALRAL